MIIYPAIDLKNKKCVRLVQGRDEDTTIYSDSPLEMAQKWIDKGAKALHLVDLDRAIHGTSKNIKVIESIVKELSVPVQVGGGIRSFEAAEELIEIGCARIILGTKAFSDKNFLSDLIYKYGEKVVVSVDTKGGKVAVSGWTESTDKDELEFLKELEEIGVKNIVYTDIAKDGMMLGPNLEALKRVLSSTKMGVIASGGVTTKEDVAELKKLDGQGQGLIGAIIGKALYEGSIQLEEVV